MSAKVGIDLYIAHALKVLHGRMLLRKLMLAACMALLLESSNAIAVLMLQVRKVLPTLLHEIGKRKGFFFSLCSTFWSNNIVFQFLGRWWTA